MLEKVIDMEKMAFADFIAAQIKYGEEDARTLELKNRWKGMLEVKQELINM